jgi:hypothetical protein
MQVRPEDLAVLHREEGARIDPAAARNEKVTLIPFPVPSSWGPLQAHRTLSARIEADAVWVGADRQVAARERREGAGACHDAAAPVRPPARLGGRGAAWNGGQLG